MEPDSTSIVYRIYNSTKEKFIRWMSKGNQKDKVPVVSSTKFEDLFPTINDSPETRVEKFANLCAVWKPQSDLNVIKYGPIGGLFFAGCLSLPLLFRIRAAFKVLRYNPLIAVTTTVGIAAGGSYLNMNYAIDKIVRGEVSCAECHLIRTGALQFLTGSLVPTFNMFVVSLFSCLHNPGLALPIDVLENWKSTKEGLKIAGRAFYQRNIIILFVIIAFFNVTESVGLLYLAMKQYHDVHSNFLKEANQKTVL